MITRVKISAVRASGVRRLFEGSAYWLFCPRCGAYSRAALNQINTVTLSLIIILLQTWKFLKCDWLTPVAISANFEILTCKNYSFHWSMFLVMISNKKRAWPFSGIFEEKILTCDIIFYYINTNEIPSELSGENFISSRVKITCYLHTWRDHRRYGYIINRAFESKLIWYFTGVGITNRILHTCLWIWILSSRVQLDISRVSCAHSWEIELTTRR